MGFWQIQKFRVFITQGSGQVTLSYRNEMLGMPLHFTRVCSAGVCVISTDHQLASRRDTLNQRCR
jgi:hypothetical protein